MSKHILGKWKLHDMENNVVVGNNHLTIADANARNRTKEANQANARLIAAAPELLLMCKFSLDMHNREHSKCTTCYEYKSLTEVIAKAEEQK